MGGCAGPGALRVPAVPDGAAPPLTGGCAEPGGFRVPAVPDGAAPPLTGGCAGPGALRVPAVPDGATPPLTGGCAGPGGLRVPAVPDGATLPPTGGCAKLETLRVPAVPDKWRSPRPVAVTPGGGEILGVPSWRMGFAARACCVLVWVLDCAEEAELVTVSDAVCTTDDFRDSPVPGLPLPPACGCAPSRTRGIGGRCGASCCS